MEIYFEKVTLENKEILFRLLQYSLFEESLNDGNEMNDEGLFEYIYFDKYFVEDSRDAYFIKELKTNKIVGFVMINTYMQKSIEGHSIAEFMIIPKYRKKYIGKSAAIKCFEMYKGNWEVSPSFGSKIAYNFWKKVIDDYTNKNNKFIDGIFIFNNK